MFVKLKDKLCAHDCTWRYWSIKSGLKTPKTCNNMKCIKKKKKSAAHSPTKTGGPYTLPSIIKPDTTHTLPSETDAANASDATVSLRPPPPPSPFLSEDWTAFCSQGPETQAVSAGNIFHSPGPTGALAATRSGSFQSPVLLGKYGSLWTGPLCRFGVGGWGVEWEKTSACDEDNWVTRYDTVW